jgi:hypothetical protein
MALTNNRKNAREVLLGLLFSLCLAVSASGEAKQRFYCGPPPPAPGTSKSAGEGAAPLPIDPGITQRRTENKRRPTPPILFAKLGYGKQLEAETPDTAGNVVKIHYWDWNTDEGDVQSLLNCACPALQVQYHWQVVFINRFDFSPRSLPCVYITGHVDFEFSEDQMAKLRNYVLAGGSLLGEACCGDEEFAKAFERFAKKLFPDRPFRPIPPDHPIYNGHYQVDEVAYTSQVTERVSNLPVLFGTNIGCRTAIIFSPYDLKRGWGGGKIHPWTRGIADEHARKIGTNIVAYILGTVELGEQISRLKALHQQGGNKAGRLSFAQIRHSGDWDPNPTAASSFLEEVRKGSFLDANFDRVGVDLTDKKLSEYPFLYMTGHLDFELSEAERKALRKHLESGGFLMVDNCCGRAQFDIAFRREFSKTFPNKRLEPLPLTHPIFHTLSDLKAVEYNENVRFLQSDLKKPLVEGLDIANRTVLAYCKYDLGNGWEKTTDPFASSYSAQDALKLGMNIVFYALTH